MNNFLIAIAVMFFASQSYAQQELAKASFCVGPNCNSGFNRIIFSEQRKVVKQERVNVQQELRPTNINYAAVSSYQYPQYSQNVVASYRYPSYIYGNGVTCSDGTCAQASYVPAIQYSPPVYIRTQPVVYRTYSSGYSYSSCSNGNCPR
jgi:hypothetical protein